MCSILFILLNRQHTLRRVKRSAKIESEITQKNTKKYDDSMLSFQQRQALVSLSQHGSISETADAVGVSRNTLYGWLKSPEFVMELTAISQVTLTSMISGVYSELENSLNVMKDTLHLSGTLDADEARTQKLRMAAAKDLLDRAERLSSTLATTARISQIEQTLKDAERR